MGLFGANKVDPKKQVNEVNSVLRRETRAVERQIRDIERNQDKTKNMLKQNAKKGDKEACRILAKELVNSKKAVSRLYASKAQMNSVMVSIIQSLTMNYSDLTKKLNYYQFLAQYENSTSHNTNNWSCRKIHCCYEEHVITN